MAQAQAELKPVDKLDRREAAEELLGYFRKHATMFGRVDDLKGRLRKLAGEAGDNFKEEFSGKGAVKVSAPKPGKFKGIVPELVIETFLALPERDRKKLVDEKKIVAMNEQYGSQFYGSVTVDVF